MGDSAWTLGRILSKTPDRPYVWRASYAVNGDPVAAMIMVAPGERGGRQTMMRVMRFSQVVQVAGAGEFTFEEAATFLGIVDRPGTAWHMETPSNIMQVPGPVNPAHLQRVN